MLRKVFAVIVATGLLAGCGRSYVAERELEKLATTYVQQVTAGKFDEAAKMLTGEAQQAAALAFPLLKAVPAKQQLVEIEAKAEPVTGNKDRGAVKVTYRVRTEIEGYGTQTEKNVGLYEFIKQGDTWKIYRISLLSQEVQK